MTIQLTLRSDLDRPLTSLEADANLATLRDAILAVGDPSGNGGVEEAPAGGGPYARQASAWVTVSAGIQHPAGTDGKFRASRNGAWAIIEPGVPAAVPSTGGPFAWNGDGWVALPSASGAGGVKPVGEWSSNTVYSQGDVVSRVNCLWAYRSNGGTTPQPSLENASYWSLISFPTTQLTEAVTDLLKHQFVTAHRSDKKNLFAIINDLETRLKAAENALAASSP